MVPYENPMNPSNPPLGSLLIKSKRYYNPYSTPRTDSSSLVNPGLIFI